MDVSTHDDTPKGIIARLQMALSRSLRALQLISTVNTSRENVVRNTNPSPLVVNSTVGFDNGGNPFTSTPGSTRARISCTLSGTTSAAATVTLSLYRITAGTPIGPSVKVDLTAAGNFTTTLDWVDETGPYTDEVFGITATASGGATITVAANAASYIIQDQ